MAQTLEAEDTEQRQRRLQNILERLDGETTTSDPPRLTFDFGDRRTFPTEPPTELLARVQQFLPQIERSNEELLQRDPHSIDMEHIEETDEHVIQMNLGLGVFEQRQRRAEGEGSSTESGSDDTSDTDSDSEEDSDTTTSSSSSSPSSSSTTGSDSEQDDDDRQPARSTRRRELRPLPHRARPLIQVLPSEDEPGGDPSPS